jgi:uracil-DNA glycosylase family 4
VRKEVALLARDLRRYVEGLDGAEKSEQRKPAAQAPPRVMNQRTLDTLRQEVQGCAHCGLHKTRTNVVFGEGHPNADIMFIGEAPGRDEDLQGKPFVGRAGQLLTKIIESIDLTRQGVFIGNVLKCRPPGNRDPSPEESVACMPYLKEQIELIQPKIICALGRISGQLLLSGAGRSLASMRGTLHDWGPGGRVKLIVTYHPAACLRNPDYKRPVWEDMKRLREEYRAMGGSI